MNLVEMKTNPEAYAKLRAEIADTRAKIAGYDFDSAEHLEGMRIWNACFKCKPEEMLALMEAAQAHPDASTAASMDQARDHIKRLEASLELDLYVLETRYVLTDGRLISPAGFHPSEGVWAFDGATTVIGTDRLPASSNLACYDVKKINEKHAA